MGSNVTQFKPGQSGNPAGRKKGSRNKITKQYLDALAADFKEYGEAVIKLLRESHPDVYVRLVAQLLPRNFDVKHSGDVTVQMVDYSDDD